MKKTLISLLYLFVGFFLFSEGFYLSPNISLKNGTAKEYVFEGDYKLSQLDWQVENQVNFGLDIDFEFKKFFLGLGFSTGLYNFGGMMEDYDWQNRNLPDYITNYSCHDLLVTEEYNFSFEFGLCFPFKQKNYGKIFLQVNNKNSTYYGIGGWWDYDENYCPSDIPPKGEFDDLDVVITYNPCLTAFYVGFGAKTYFAENAFINFEGYLGFASGVCTDVHLETNTLYQDYISGFFLVKNDICLGYNFSEKSTLILGGKLENTPILEGVTYKNGYPTYGGIGGFSSFSYNFYLSYRIRML